jgi:prepilin-type N-terminal cleavage/methylation domain-containing protein
MESTFFRTRPLTQYRSVRGFTRTPLFPSRSAARFKHYQHPVDTAQGMTRSLRTTAHKTAMGKVVSGFTLVEMLVVLGIMAVITGIALFGQIGFNRSILLTDTAYTVALSLREMQSLGLSSRKFAAVQNAGYGAYIDAANPSSYVLFADTVDADAGAIPATCTVGVAGTPEAKPGDCIYTLGSDGIVQTYTFSRGFAVTNFCGKSGASRYCSTDTTTPLTELNIVFLRSNTESIVVAKRNGAWMPLTSAEIYISSADALASRAICISRVGQISVTNSTTCP